MTGLAARVILVFGLLVAVTGGTAALAADSLPDSPFYPVKLAMEQASLNFKGEAEGKAIQQLNMTQARLREINRLVEEGEAPGEALNLRLENHLNLALQLAEQLDEAGKQGLLTQAGEIVQAQLQQMTQTRAMAQVQPEEPLQQTIRILEQARLHIQTALQNGTQQQAGKGQDGEPPCQDDCEPVGEAYKHGQEDGDPGQYGPGEQFGNPDCQDCEPLGDEHKYGQEAEDAGPHGNQGEDCVCCSLNEQEDLLCNETGEPGQDGTGDQYGNPDCPICEPLGDEHKYGQGSEEPGAGPGPGTNDDSGSQNHKQTKNSGGSGKKP